MAEIHLEKRLRAPIDHVFELLSDHGEYRRFPGIHASELVHEGASEPNGLGARRRITARPLTFVEEITAFERPTRMDYLIVEVNFPLRHHGGSIELTAVGDSTDVLWRSRFDVTIPVVGGALGGPLAAIIKRGFARILDDIESRAPVAAAA